MSSPSDSRGIPVSYEGDLVMVLYMKHLGSLIVAASLDLLPHVGSKLPLFTRIIGKLSDFVHHSSVPASYAILGQEAS